MAELAGLTTREFLARTPFGENESAIVEDQPLDVAAETIGWGYEVEKVPAYALKGEPVGLDYSPTFEPAKGCYLTRRTDTGQVLGHVGNAYRVQQNADVIDRIRPIVDEGLGTLAAGGVMKGGGKAWALVKFDQRAMSDQAVNNAVERLFYKEGISPWALLIVNHSGGRADNVVQLPFRLACLNMLPGLISRQGGSIRHTLSVASQWDAATKKLYFDVTAGYKRFAREQEMLRETTLPWHEFERRVLDIGVPVPELGPEPGGKRKAAVGRAMDRRKLVAALWTNGADHRGDRSAWEALNGLVQAQDHGMDFYRRGSRLSGNVNGHITSTKRKVLKSLMEYAYSVRN
jgi:hypothetical protein